VTLIAGLTMTVAFVLWELRAPAPMLPMRLFASPGFAAGNVTSFLLFASNFSTVFFMAQFQQVARGQHPLSAGVRLLPWTAPLFLVGPRAGALVDRVGERSLVVAGLVMQSAGMAWIALIAKPGLAYPTMIAAMVISSTGIALAMPAVQKAVLGSVEPADIGKASGTYNTSRWFGAVFGVAILIAVFAGTGSYASPQAFSHGFVWAIAVSAAIALLGAGVGLVLPSRPRQPALSSAAAPAIETDGAR
jgi:MFS family permease